jgi:hypothetical protein
MSELYMMRRQYNKHWARELVNARYAGAQEDWLEQFSEVVDQAATVVDTCNGFMVAYKQQQLEARLARIDPSDTAEIARVTEHHNSSDDRELASQHEHDQWMRKTYAEHHT